MAKSKYTPRHWQCEEGEMTKGLRRSQQWMGRLSIWFKGIYSGRWIDIGKAHRVF